MKSKGSMEKRFERNKPQVMPMTLTWEEIPFKSQLLCMCCRLLGRVAESLRVTVAPHLLATMPGNAVPDPSSRIFLPGSSLRCSQRNQARTGADGQM